MTANARRLAPPPWQHRPLVEPHGAAILYGLGCPTDICNRNRRGFAAGAGEEDGRLASFLSQSTAALTGRSVLEMDPFEFWRPYIAAARANLTTLNFPENISPDWIRRRLAEMKCSPKYPATVAHSLMLARELCLLGCLC